jgi:DNA-directed RNA polymerase subunit RPC12/RpoP
MRMAAKEGYCVKCKAKREIKDAKEITMKNGRPATQGLCPECGTKIFKIGK